MDYMTLKEASEKWGVSSRQVKPLLRRWAYSRRGKVQPGLADTQRRGRSRLTEEERISYK